MRKFLVVLFVALALPIACVPATLSRPSRDTPPPLAVTAPVVETRAFRPAPTPSHVPHPMTRQEREEFVSGLLKKIVSDSHYNTAEQVLHKYIDAIRIEVSPPDMAFVLLTIPESADDVVGLGLELLHIGAIACHYDDDDWGMDRISVSIPGRNDAHATLSISNHDTIVQVAERKTDIVDAMDSDVDLGSSTMRGVVNSAANLRAGPGTSYAIIGTAQSGQSADIVGHQSVENWYQLASGAWIWAPLVDVNSQVPEATATSTDVPTGCPTGCCPAPPGCTIKGNVGFTTTEKIYHIPGCESYDETAINCTNGERWFCTEAEAVASGWRKARNCP